MEAHAVFGDVAQRVVECLDAHVDGFTSILSRRRIGRWTNQAWTIDLKQETGVDDHLVLGAYRFRDGVGVLLVGSVVLVALRKSRRGSRDEDLFHSNVLERVL